MAMHNHFTNLMPSERQRALKRDYYLRLAVVVALFVSAITAIAMALLAPTYVFLTESIHAKKQQLASIESSYSSASDKTLSARLNALAAQADSLIALSKEKSVGALVRSLLAISRPGISLSGIGYVPATAKTPGTLTIRGTAWTRDALRNYQLAIQDAPFAQTVDLPVSAFAQNSDISFTITVTLAP